MCDMDLPVKLHMDADEEFCSATLVQGQGDDYRVIAFQGRPLTITESKRSRIERLMIATNWALKKMGRYTQYVP